MDQLQLYLNDELVDLSDDHPIALTYQINNLAEVKNQQGNTSNQFKLPLTQRNRRILGFPDDVAFTNCKPYRQFSAKIVQDGLEIIPYGIGELNGIDQDTAAVTILSGNVDFFDAIDGKIYDMGDNKSPFYSDLWANYNHDWSVKNVVYSQLYKEGWIWPVVDYGRIDTNFEGTPLINVRYLRPGFFLKTAIELIAQKAGYTIDPKSSLINDELYNKLIVQFANDSFEHGTKYQNQLNSPYGVSAAINQQLLVTHIPINDNAGNIRFSSNNADPSGQFSDGVFFTSKQIITSEVNVYIPQLRFQGRVTGGHQSTLNIYLLVNGGIKTQVSIDLNGDFVRISGSGGSIFGYKDVSKIKLSAPVELNVGTRVWIAYEFFGDRPAQFTIFPGATLTITPKDKQVLYGQNIQCERILPDINAKDLLKDTLQRFGIICQTDNVTRTIRLASFRDIVNNIPLAKNWTSKCIDQGKAISFQLGGYAQINYMKYKQDDAIIPATYGQSQINVKDTNLPATADLFESQFAPTLNRPYIGGSISQILKIDTSNDANATDFSISTQPRILINDVLELKNRSVKFTDGNAANDITVNDHISVPYFDKTGATESLSYEYLRTHYYPELEKILKETKKVTRYFLLTPRDILELDLLVPVYLEQDGAYYYINKIDGWRKGQPTKVELVKLG